MKFSTGRRNSGVPDRWFFSGGLSRRKVPGASLVKEAKNGVLNHGQLRRADANPSRSEDPRRSGRLRTRGRKIVSGIVFVFESL